MARKVKKWIEPVRGKDGRYHYRIKAANGEIENSSQPYSCKGNCTRAMKRLSESTGLPIKE